MQQPLVQVLPGQQVAPAPPQTAQIDPLQMVFAAVQVLLAQQGPPAAPHATQVLLELLHPVPGSWQAPPVDVLEQHACPVPPQTLHA